MSNQIDIKELHWLLAVTQNIDVGIVVLDREYRVQVWNTFMENRSGVVPYEASNQSIFKLFPELNQKWFSKKVDNVITLGTPAFTIWEQRPYLVRFKNYQPITGREDFMYQNTTMFPLRSTNSEITHICLVIYDVTDVATNRHQLQAANTELHRLSSTDSLTEIFNHGHFKSMLKREITVEDALNARLISWPFGLYDCAAQSDGAAAAIITRRELAKGFRDDFVLVRAIGIALAPNPQEDPSFDFLRWKPTVSAVSWPSMLPGSAPSTGTSSLAGWTGTTG